MKEIKGCVYTFERCAHIIEVHRVTLEDFDFGTPWQVLNLSGITDQDTDIESISEKGANETTADIT
jgi:hypothetical protein